MSVYKLILISMIIGSFSDARIIDVQFDSEEEWLFGQSWGGSAFGSSIEIGSAFVGESEIFDFEVVDIDMYLSQNPDSNTVAWVYSAVDTGVVIGLGSFPGSVYDVSNPDVPRRLNVVFFEEDGGDLIWNPDDMWNGNYEYLLVMMSDYDLTGDIYLDQPAFDLDVQYFCWLKRKPGHEWFETEPATLTFRNFWELSVFTMEIGNGEFTLFWEFEYPPIETDEIDHYNLLRGTAQNTLFEISQIPVGVGMYLDAGLEIGENYYYRLNGINSEGEIVLESSIISAQASIQELNTELLENWDSGHENVFLEYGVSTYNDIWGYTDELGNEYALIGTWDGTHIINISSNPAVETAFVPGSYSTHRDIKTYSNYMYVGTEANFPDPIYFEDGSYYIEPQGVQVVDLSDPANPIVVTEWDGVVQSHNIMEADGFLYVIGSTQYYSNDGMEESWGLDDLIILDLSDPENPEKVGGWSDEYFHDVCVSGDILYGCGIYSGTMWAMDISDKTNPQVISTWNGVPSAHACWVSDDGNTVFTASETVGGHIISWDVTDLNNVTMLGEWLPSGGEAYSAHNIFIRGDHLYISYYVYGLQILNVENPVELTLSGVYDTFRQSPTSIFDGAWGVFPYFDSGKIVVSDRQTGLYVVDFQEEELSVDNDYVQSHLNLYNNYPNPFNGTTLIEYQLDKPENVQISIYDIQGRFVRSLVNSSGKAGRHSVYWDGMDYSGSSVPTGIYLYSLQTQTETITRDLLYLK